MDNSQQSAASALSESQAPQTAQQTTQAGMQPQYSSQAAYPMQGSAAMVPQYQQAPMGQVYQFPQGAGQPLTTQAGPPGLDSQYLNTIQTQASLLDRVVGYLSTPLGSLSRGGQSNAQPIQDYSRVDNPMHQRGYPQQQPQAYSPNSSQHSQQSQMLLNQMQTQVGMQAALTVQESDLSALSRVAMNAYACDLEERLAVAGMALEKAKMVAGDAIMMRALFDCVDEEAVHHLSICALDSIVRTPGAMDVFLEYFVPVIQGLNAEHASQYQPRAASVSWGNGGDPLARNRQGFPAPPEMGGGQNRPVDLNQIPPAERWKYIDAMSAR